MVKLECVSIMVHIHEDDNCGNLNTKKAVYRKYGGREYAFKSYYISSLPFPYIANIRTSYLFAFLKAYHKGTILRAYENKKVQTCIGPLGRNLNGGSRNVSFLTVSIRLLPRLNVAIQALNIKLEARMDFNAPFAHEL